MKRVLPIIVISQFFCTTLWFAGNTVITEIVNSNLQGSHLLPHIASAIQFGFITGTFVFALFTIADRIPPSLVFFLSAILAGIFNLGITLDHISISQIILYRFLTGFFLAGIYPVGMKIASDHFQATLGKSLGFLVGALVLGTAFPHLLKNYLIGFPWKYVLYATTGFSFIGGTAMLLFVPVGPYRKPAQRIQITAFLHGFREKNFRAAAFGYFGHMWELYAFWTFVPLMLKAYDNQYPAISLNIPLLSFSIIAIGCMACVVSGVLSQYMNPKKLAGYALLVSCICCLLFPIVFFLSSPFFFLLFLFIWGFAVIADSPLFSTLVAQQAPAESRGTSLTIVNCIGFAITIVSIQLIGLLQDISQTPYIYMLLAIGPMLGLVAINKQPSITTSKDLQK
jgi:MFS family permease